MPGTLFILPDKISGDTNLRSVSRKLKRTFVENGIACTSEPGHDKIPLIKRKNKIFKKCLDTSDNILYQVRDDNRCARNQDKGDNCDTSLYIDGCEHREMGQPAFATSNGTTLHKTPLKRNYLQSSNLDNGHVESPVSSNHGDCSVRRRMSPEMSETDKKAKLGGSKTIKGEKASKNCLPSESDYVALDCEFVGVGERKTSALGRCSIVNFSGRVLLDVYVRPEAVITDYRTRWSGIRRRDMDRAIPFDAAKTQIQNILKNKIVVGHAIYNDFKVLGCSHPSRMIRDTSGYRLLRKKAGIFGGGSMSLKKLTANLLGRTIQRREHCSVEDARASLDLFKLVRTQWERKIRQRKTTIGQNGDSSENITTETETSLLDDLYWPDHLLEINSR
ncbi:hypothetical protein ScPMuIL_002606 [Solemya velum]